MKQLLALVFVGSLLTVPAQADYLKNPDRTLSMGVDVTATHLDNAFPGLHLFDASGGRNLFLPDRQPITSHFLTLDVRCPLSEAITMDAHGGSWTQEAFQGTSNGYTIGGGLRYYFHGGD